MRTPIDDPGESAVLATARMQVRWFIQGPGGGQHRTLPRVILTNTQKDDSIIIMKIFISLIGAYIQMVDVTA